MPFPSIEEIVLSFILQLHTTLVHMNPQLNLKNKSVCACMKLKLHQSHDHDHGDEGICGNRILSSTQWELLVKRLPDWKRLSVGDVVKVRSVANKVD